MSEKTKIGIMLGTAREGAKSEEVARAIEKLVDEREDSASVYIDPKEHVASGDGHNSGSEDKKLKAQLDESSALIVVVPEYNRSYPGSLKRMFDLEYDVYNRMPVLIVSVSAGPWGGLRGGEALIPVLRHVGMLISRYEVPVPNVNSAVDEYGNLRQEIHERLVNGIDDILWLSNAVKLAGKN